jgi:phosphotransferase system  glucose/maltose/N-acetylglucosamine-specific IIC component
MSKSKPSMIEILDANIKFIYGLLAMPYIGMIIALGLIFYKKPDNMVIVIAVIFFLMVQYGFTVVFFLKRFNTMVKKKEKETLKKLVEENE